MLALLERKPTVYGKQQTLPHQPFCHHVLNLALEGNAGLMSGSQSGLCCAVAKRHSDDKRNSFVTAAFEIYFIISWLLYSPSQSGM